MLALVGALLAAPGSVALLDEGETSSREVAFYLHSSLSATNAHTVSDYAVQAATAITGVVRVSGLAPWMDESPPTGGQDKLAYASAFGNPNFNRNGLLTYWMGEAVGRVSDAEATLYLSSPNGGSAAATLFRDARQGIGSAFASVTMPVPAGGPHEITFDFGDAAANVEGTLVLSVSAVAADGVVVHHDSLGAPSSLRFMLGSFAPPPPPGEITPAPGWLAPTMVSDNLSHRETSIVISPVDADLMVVCAPSGVPNTRYNQSYFHLSRDGGATWEWLDVETASSDPRTMAFEGGDCDVAFDDAGTMYSADTWLGSLSVGHSRDGGRTWMGTSLAATAPIVDRPWLVGGPEGVVHVTWQDVQFGMPSLIWYARSTDYGLTFSPAVSVTTANADGAFTWTGNLVVSPDQQSLYSIYTRRGSIAISDLDSTGPESVWVAASHDGGLTWTQNLVAQLTMPASYLYPSLAMDAAGTLHAVYSSKTSDDRPIWYTSSADGGQTWTTPIKVLPGTAGWSPWVVASGAGEAAIQWYGSPNPKANLTAKHDWYLYTARVKDGAVTQAGPTTLTPLFTGVSGMPEFNQLRLGPDDKIHLGASVYHTNENGVTWWAIIHQREA